MSAFWIMFALLWTAYFCWWFTLPPRNPVIDAVLAGTGIVVAWVPVFL